MRKDLEIVSFDLQGTLSDSRFSDEFWRDVFPQAFAMKHQVSFSEAKKTLQKQFSAWGKYDYRYYSYKYWQEQLGLEPIREIADRMKHRPLFDIRFVPLLEMISKEKKIIISSTTTDFIDLELGEYGKYFYKAYSSLDHFGIAGKPAELFKKIAQELGVSPQAILHIGDNKEMDVVNAKSAGLQALFIPKGISMKQKLIILEKELRTHHTSHLSSKKST